MGHNGFPAGRGSASAFSFSAGRGFAAAPIGTIAPILLAREKESRLHRHFEQMMQALWEQKGSTLSVNIVTDPRAIGFIDTHADILDSAFSKTEMTGRMRARLERSTWIFSGMKAIREMGEAFPSLTDENGNRKPFQQFLNDVRKVDETYNQHYLRAEYEFAAVSANMAAKWERFAEDGDRYNLQYRTAGDNRVRPEHAALDGITLPPSDSFWESYFPPNGWRCRCDVVQVRKSKYPETPHDEAMQLGELATQKDTKNIFRFNPGKQQRVFPAANPYTSSKCNGCELGAQAKGSKKLSKTLLDKTPDYLICQACKYLNGCLEAKTIIARHNAADHIKQVKTTINAHNGARVVSKDFVTGELIVLRRSLQDVFEHGVEDGHLMDWLSTFSINDIKKWAYEGWAENRPYDVDHPLYDPNNPDKKKHKETEYFLYYSLSIKNKKYWANVKMHKNFNGEVLYTIEFEKPEDIITGLPPQQKKKNKGMR